MFLLLPSVIQNHILAEQSGVFVVSMRNFCVNLVTLLIQEYRKSILLIKFHSFLYFSQKGWAYDVCVQVRIFRGRNGKIFIMYQSFACMSLRLPHLQSEGKKSQTIYAIHFPLFCTFIVFICLYKAHCTSSV